MLCLMIFVAALVYSQSVVYSVSGIVADETEIPIENVSVYENGTLLRGVTDSNGYIAFTTERQEIILSFSHISYELEAVQFHLENIEKTTEGIYFVRVSLQKKNVLLPEVSVKANIPVFAFENNQLSHYDKTGEEIETIPMTFHRVSNQKSVLNPNWVQEIVIDKAENRCYAQFIVNGIITLREIDLKSGNLMREIYVNHPFPEKIQIYNNCVYADRSLSFPDKKSLYRMRIND